MFVKKFDGGDFLILLLYINDMLIVGQDPKKIGSLKKTLSKSFAMKDLGPTNQILGMHIVRARATKLFWLSQEKYMTKMLQRFSMANTKSVGSTLSTNCKMSVKQSSKMKTEKGEMMKVPYTSVVRSLMYAMVCTRSDIGHAIEVVRKFMRNPGTRSGQLDTLIPKRILEHGPQIRLK